MAADRPTSLPKRLRVDTYQVQKCMYLLIGGELKKTVTLGLSPLFGSRFAAVKALRELRKKHPTAALTRNRVDFSHEDHAVRTAFLSQVVRPGDRP